MIRVGIFFGGPSREREISFAGGRTVYDNLDKALFDAVPVFVDSLGNFIQLNWEYIYKGTIRDFYPATDSEVYLKHSAPDSPFQRYIESLDGLTGEELDHLIQLVGKPLQPAAFKEVMDVAFLCLHGPYGEDGVLQGLLEWYGIPYTGSGVLPSAIGIDKLVQDHLLRLAGFNRPAVFSLDKAEWLAMKGKTSDTLIDRIGDELGWPVVVKSPSQGSSIGVSVVQQPDAQALAQALDRSFFLQRLRRDQWDGMTQHQKLIWIRTLVDIREGMGLPVILHQQQTGPMHIASPDHLFQWLNTEPWTGSLLLESPEGEERIMLEAFIKGREFSCIVIEDEAGEPIALPPTEILKNNQVFDYRSKYLPGMARKVTPIDLPEAEIERIRQACESLYQTLRFDVYARIDGFLGQDGNIYLNDPNTTSGMLPSSFFFHQAAEVGLNPSQFLTYIISTSLKSRLRKGRGLPRLRSLLSELEQAMDHQASSQQQKERVAVIMGGYSSERHISVESGRNIFEKLSSSVKYSPIPVFLTGSSEAYRLFQLPLNLMLKDNADDIADKVLHPVATHPVIAAIRAKAAGITKRFAGNMLTHAEELSFEQLAQQADMVFIALHGRPGEDGEVQKHLERVGLPYNGSGPASSARTINKYETNKILRENGVLVADHTLVYKQTWLANPEAEITRLETLFGYPFIAKPADDGCSSAVKKLKNRAQLSAFAEQMFREQEDLLTAPSEVLGLAYQEEFPQKDYFLVETLIDKGDAVHFLEVTGGMLTHRTPDGQKVYEVFEPSEALASGEVLSLEEKFLAGEGQNITPARFATDAMERQRISDEVKQTLMRTAQLLDVEGYCRIDAFVRVFADGRVETIVIEINSLPGMTPATCIFHQSAINGYKPYQFIDSILGYGVERQKARVAQ